MRYGRTLNTGGKLWLRALTAFSFMLLATSLAWAQPSSSPPDPQGSSPQTSAQAQSSPSVSNEPGARQCLFLRDIESSTVVDAQTILFKLNNGKIFQNRLTATCPELAFEKAFSHTTPQTQLCRSDIISVLEHHGGTLRKKSSCTLGLFTPFPPAPPAPQAAQQKP